MPLRTGLLVPEARSESASTNVSVATPIRHHLHLLMRFEVLRTADCPNAAAIIHHLEQAAAERPDVSLQVTEVGYDQVPPAAFAGSPTVLVDGRDPFGGTSTEAAACALHPPTVAQVLDLLAS